MEELYHIEKAMVDEYRRSGELPDHTKKNQAQAHIANTYLEHMRGLFDRRVMVFVHNLGAQHWTVTWVINPGHIQYLAGQNVLTLTQVNEKNDLGEPRTGFLYYDSLGDRRACNQMPAKLGLQNFLNFAHTYLLGCDRGDHNMKHRNTTPFGVPDFNRAFLVVLPSPTYC